MKLSDLRGRAVLPLPEGGAMFYGLGRDASYDAADKGLIPCISIGRRRVMPVYQALRDHGMPDELIAQVLLGTTPPDRTEAEPGTGSATAIDAPAKDSPDDDAPEDKAKSNRHLQPVTGL